MCHVKGEEDAALLHYFNLALLAFLRVSSALEKGKRCEINVLCFCRRSFCADEKQADEFM